MKNNKISKSFFKNQYFQLFLSGALSSLAFAPLYLFPVLFFSFFGLLRFLEAEKSRKKIFWGSWWFGFGHFVVGLYWLVVPLMIDPVRFAWLVPFAVTLIPGILAFYIAFTSLISCWLKQKLQITNKLVFIIIFAFVWTVSELLRTYLFSGFPWNLLGYIWCFSDFTIQIASIITIYGLSFAAVIFSALPFVFISINKKNHFHLVKMGKIENIQAIVYFLLFILIFGYGFIVLQNKEETKLPASFRLIQPNIPQDLKWEPQEAVFNVLKQINLSNENKTKVDYIIWSESSIPFTVVDEDDLLLNEISKQLNNTILLAGGLRGKALKNEKRINQIWNSLLVIKDGKLNSFYDKEHLVPFGEYLPFRWLIPSFISKITSGDLDFSSGTGRQILDLGKIKIRPLICYEDIFPFLVKTKEEFDLIVVITNDAWFGRTSAPYQHLDAARIRAIENKKPVVRVANTGITAFINRYGQIEQKISLNKQGYLDL